MIYHYWEHPEMKKFIKLWNEKAIENGLEGVFFIAMGSENNISHAFELGFNGFNIGTSTTEVYQKTKSYWWIRQWNRITGRPLKTIDYKYFVKNIISDKWSNEHIYPTAMPNWDHSPRTGSKGIIYTNCTPLLFKEHLSGILENIKKKQEENIIFIKSWNEWGEGNYLEPDVKWGTQYLDVIKEVFN